MKVRGQRECKDCGARWSYYETGSVECPSCGSLRSVGVDSERRLHTDSPAELDLTEARETLDARSGTDDIDPGALRAAADGAKDLAREYVRKRGFVRGGDLRELDDTYLGAQELRHVADVVGRGLDPSDDEEWYFLALLREADADDPERPAPGEVPESMHSIRGLAYADAVAEYRRDLSDWADEAGVGDPAESALETLREHEKRVQALDGDVTPETAELLVQAARDLGRYLRESDDDALASARERFDRLAP